MNGAVHETTAHRLLELAERAADFEEATYLASAAAAHASLAVLAELQAMREKGDGKPAGESGGSDLDVGPA
jgi:hypothetical protein